MLIIIKLKSSFLKEKSTHTHNFGNTHSTLLHHIFSFFRFLGEMHSKKFDSGNFALYLVNIEKLFTLCATSAITVFGSVLSFQIFLTEKDIKT